jgi:hypothetical protein
VLTMMPVRAQRVSAPGSVGEERAEAGSGGKAAGRVLGL